jgi:hypothetical protein
MLEIDGNQVVGFYRATTGEKNLKVALADPPVVVDWSDVPTDVQDAVWRLREEAGIPRSEWIGCDWFVDCAAGDVELVQGGDNDTPGDAEGGQGDGEPDGEPNEDGSPDQGDGDAEGDDQEGEPVEDNPNQPFLDMIFKNEDRNKDGEDESTGNQMVDDIWKLIQPLVEAMDQNSGEHLWSMVQKACAQLMFGQPDPDNMPKDDDRPYKAPKFDGKMPGNPKGGPGEHMVYRKLLSLIARRIPVYLPGVPGVGKSHMAEQAAQELGLPFGVISFSPQSTESKLLGYNDANGNYVRTIFRDLYEFGGVFLMDELDNANGAVVAVMNGGLAQNFMAFPDGVVERHPDFVCIATANTFGTGPTAEFAGRQKLDAATLNRFVKMEVPNDDAIEDAIVFGILGEDLGSKWLLKVRHVRAACAELRIKTFVTMRDSILGAKMIQPGPGKFSQIEALEMTCMCLLTDDQKKKVKAWKPGKQEVY